MTCWLKTMGAPGPCDGPIDKAHLIPKQRIKRELAKDLTPEQLQEAVWHPSVWRPMCRKHHTDLDNGVYALDRHNIPESVEAFARIWGMEWSLEADYGLPVEF